MYGCDMKECMDIRERVYVHAWMQYEYEYEYRRLKYICVRYG